MRELRKALNGFMLVSVPVPVDAANVEAERLPPRPGANRRDLQSRIQVALLLQRKEREMIPSLSLEVEDGVVRVLARHDGHQQVVDLCVRATRSDGEEYFLTPPGVWRLLDRTDPRSEPLDARTSLLIFGTGQRSIELIEARVPEELRGARLTAWLHNPGMRPDGLLSPVGVPVNEDLK